MLRTSEERAGRTANCPACGSTVTVPHVRLGDVDLTASDDIYGDETYEFHADDDRQEELPSSPPPVNPSQSRRKDFDSVFSDKPSSPKKQFDFDDDDDDDDYSVGQNEDCPMCGAKVSSTAQKCPRCGERLFDGRESQDAHHYAPHRGGLILGLGIASFFTCCIFLGIASWVMGNEDVREMDAGRMDPEGRDLTQAGRIMGIVSVVIQAAFILFFCCLALIGQG